MIDDRNVTPSSQETVDSPTWSRYSNIFGWPAYLGKTHAEENGYAAAARATNLSRLPPAYVAVGQYDVFRDEDITYAQRLLSADIPVELHVYPGTVHGS